MAKGEVNDFLKKFYRRLHAGAMDYDVLARLADNRKKGLLTKEQESWFTNGFFEEDNDPQNKLGIRAADEPALSDTDELHTDELENLYTRLAKAMYSMKSASADYGAKDTDATNFVKRYIDDLQLFPVPQATQECEDAIQTGILGLLKEDGKTDEQKETIKNIKQRIVQTAKTYDSEGKEKQVFKDVAALDKFIKDKVETKKYNTDKAVQDKLKAIASGLYNNWQSSYQGDDVTLAVSEVGSSLATIYQDAAFGKIVIDPNKLDKFRDTHGAELLSTLYYNKDIRDKFAPHDSDLVDKITGAEGKISYQDPNSTEYLKPKTDDVLTPVQQIQKWATDTYKNSIRKYMRLRGDPLLFSGYSKEIFKAIDKAEVKPTDGIDGLVSKAGDIKKSIPNKTTMEHFDWFLKTMEEIKAEYPKAYDGAWNNAAQMKCVITQIMLKATGPNAKEEDMDKAKTAMEIMTAMKYGMMTSKVMDALKQEEFKIFSDGNLSWNKNEGIQFITKCFDKSIKAAFLGVGYGITFVRNKIMMSGMKFKDKNNQKGALKTRNEEERARLATKHVADQSVSNEKIDIMRQDIAEKTAEADHLRHFISRQPTYEANYQRLIQNQENTMNRTRANHDLGEAAKNKIDEDEKLREEFKTLQAERRTLRQELRDLENQMNPLRGLNDAPAMAKAQVIQSKITPKQEKYDEVYNKMKELTARLRDPAYVADLHNARTDMATYQADYDEYNRASRIHKYLQERYQKLIDDPVAEKNARLTEATETITELNDNINKQNEAMRNWPEQNHNKLKELEDFWNFLQTGKATTWGLSTSRAQEKFDANKNMLLQQYVSRHGMAD